MPWADLLTLAQRHLNILPREFWQLSIAEWNCLMSTAVITGTGPMGRMDFDALAAAFPDTLTREI